VIKGKLSSIYLIYNEEKVFEYAHTLQAISEKSKKNY
jgi:hypothetical protein